jgi:hypothetical protein
MKAFRKRWRWFQKMKTINLFMVVFFGVGGTVLSLKDTTIEPFLLWIAGIMMVEMVVVVLLTEPLKRWCPKCYKHCEADCPGLRCEKAWEFPQGETCAYCDAIDVCAQYAVARGKEDPLDGV